MFTSWDNVPENSYFCWTSPRILGFMFFYIIFRKKYNLSMHCLRKEDYLSRNYSKFSPNADLLPHKSRIMFIWFSLLGKSPKYSLRILWFPRSGWPGGRSSRMSSSPSRGSRRKGGRMSQHKNVRDQENLSRDEIPKLLVNNKCQWTRFIQGKMLNKYLGNQF